MHRIRAADLHGDAEELEEALLGRPEELEHLPALSRELHCFDQRAPQVLLMYTCTQISNDHQNSTHASKPKDRVLPGQVPRELEVRKANTKMPTKVVHNLKKRSLQASTMICEAELSPCIPAR